MRGTPGSFQLIVRLLGAAGCVAASAVATWPGPAHAQAGIPYLADDDGEGGGDPIPPEGADLPPTKVKLKAKGKEPDATKVAPPPPAVEPAPPPIATPRHDDRFFADLWSKRRDAQQAKNPIAARQILEQILDAQRQSGWPNLVAYGLAVAREAERQSQSGQHEEALALADAAAALAPDRTETHIARSRASFAAGGHFFDAIGAYLRAFSLTWTVPHLLWARLSTMLLALLAALLLAGATFAVIVVYRHGRLFVHDLHHLLPRGATRLQGALFGAALLLAPVFFRLGLGWTVLVWVVLAGIYYERHERIGAALVLAALAGVALGLPAGLAQLSYAGSRQEDRYLAATDLGAAAAAARLEGLPDPSAGELFVLGMRATWAGDVGRAVDLLSRAERAGQGTAALYVTLGNLAYGQGDRNAAIAHYDHATRVEPDDPLAYFNMSRVFHSMTESTKGNSAHRQAIALDSARVEELEREAKRNGPEWVSRAPVPNGLLWSTPSGTAETERSARQIWLWVGGSVLPRIAFALACLAGAILVVLMAWLRRGLRPSSSCSRCGAPACRRCNAELSDQTICGQCYHAFVVKDDVPPQARVRKEIEVHRYQARALRVRQILSLMLVGTGQMLTGRPLIGLVFLVLFASGVLGALVAADLVPSPIAELRPTRAASLALCVPIALVAYALGLWAQSRSERR